MFQITEAGCRVLGRWLSAPEPEEATFRIPTLVKLFFGHRMDRETLTRLLDRFATEVEGEMEGTRAINDVLAGVPTAAHAWASALYGLRMHEACLSWAREVRERLASDDWAGAPHQPQDSELARDLFAAAPARSSRPRR